MRKYHHETVEADRYRCRTIITYTEGAEVREYEIAADELSDWYVSMSDPIHGEEIVSIDPIERADTPD